jgi:hypothetical protein
VMTGIVDDDDCVKRGDVIVSCQQHGDAGPDETDEEAHP